MGGDLSGDWYQTGGTIVVQPGNVVTFSFKQEQPSDHAEPADILKALNIEASPEVAAGTVKDDEINTCGEGCSKM